jgi:hypothetical protein
MVRVVAVACILLAACAFDGGGPSDEEPETETDTVDPPIDPIEEDDPVGQDTTPTPVMLAPGCTATATLGGHPAWFFFTRPDKPCKGTVGTDRHIVDELIRLIKSVPAGGRIDGHIFSITVDGVAQALLEAQQNGVQVWISTDGAVKTSTDTAKTLYLDKLAHIVYCGSATTNACISTADGGISHTKLFVFSTATAPDGAVANNVVWMSSANQTYASGMKLYNNAVTVLGDATLYTKLKSYLDDLYAQRRRADYYDAATARGYMLSTAADVYASPEADTDLVVNRLNDVTPDASCRVRVLQASVRDSRLDVVQQLVRMKQGGCKVTVVAHTIEPDARAALRAGGIEMRTAEIHDKTFLIYGKFGASYAYRAYSGSHNLSGSANRRYDEIFVKLAPETGAVHPVFDAYLAHFDDAYASGASVN